MSTILIADDIAENLYLLKSLFLGNGHAVVSAENGARALELAQASPPDLIVTDILMPVMDGFELCRRWKADDRLKGIPFVFYTATYVGPEDERLALSLGAERFVVKPQKPDVLMQIVREVLEEAAKGLPGPDSRPLGDEMEVMRQYNAVLFHKLERKVMQLQAEIAERKEAQEALRESQARLLDAHRLASIGFWSWDTGNDTVTWSEQIHRIAGLDPSQPAPGRTDHAKFFTAEGWKRLEGALDETFRTGEPYEFEAEVLRPDGARRWISGIGGAKRAPDGRICGLHGTIQDVTERRRVQAERERLEAHSRHQQKLEEIGILAAGVAHEINNPLSVILSYSEILAESPEDPTRVKDLASTMLKESERIAAIVRNLLRFARQEKEPLGPARLADIVESALSLARAVFVKDHVQVRCEIPGDLPAVTCRSQQVQQVVMNLLTNARDALNARFPERSEDKVIRIVASALEKNGVPFQRLTVEDRGGGIPPDVAERVFDPFFTTKPGDGGTGLGLSISYGIVAEHNGVLWFETEPGRGTAFHVDLPAESA